MTVQAVLPLLVVLFGCIAAIVTDVRRYKIYNSLTIPLLAGGLLYHQLTSGLQGLWESGAGVLAGFFILFVPYLVGVMGGGDVKLLAAIGAWLGYPLTVVVAALGCATAAMFSLTVLAKQGRLHESWTGFQVVVLRLHALASQLGCEDEREQFRAEVSKSMVQRRRVVPFSIMLTIGIVALMLHRAWVV